MSHFDNSYPSYTPSVVFAVQYTHLTQLCIFEGDTIWPNMNRLFDPLFGAKANIWYSPS